MRAFLRTALGFFAASLVPAVILSILTPVGSSLSLRSALVSFSGFYPISIATTLVLGFPAFLLLRRYGRLTWWKVGLVGAFLGIIVQAIVVWPAFPHLKGQSVYGVMGAVSALVFWLIWRRNTSSETERPEAESEFQTRQWSALPDAVRPEAESEFQIRQWSALLDAVHDYRAGLLPLNKLIFRVEAASAALKLPAWLERVTPIVGELEQINAAILNRMTTLDSEQKSIEAALRRLELAVRRFRPAPEYWFEKHLDLSVSYVRVFLNTSRVFLVLYGFGLTYAVLYISYDLLFSAEPSYPRFFWIVIAGMSLFVGFTWMGLRFVNRKLQELKR